PPLSPLLFFPLVPPPPPSTLFPYTTLFRSPHHVRDGLPCQDAHTYRLQGDYLIAVISDGAGSACYSQLGSQAITDTLVQVLAERSEEHTSELQSRENLVCRLLLEKKKSRSD